MVIRVRGRHPSWHDCRVNKPRQQPGQTSGEPNRLPVGMTQLPAWPFGRFSHCRGSQKDLGPTLNRIIYSKGDRLSHKVGGCLPGGLIAIRFPIDDFWGSCLLDVFLTCISFHLTGHSFIYSRQHPILDMEEEPLLANTSSASEDIRIRSRQMVITTNDREEFISDVSAAYRILLCSSREK
ncbi:hypothetical protein TNCV_4739541 [Trichonephila clavipes]|nr:hypothetical protein TNCV_4739541 [Trichonephila clavipes]